MITTGKNDSSAEYRGGGEVFSQNYMHACQLWVATQNLLTKSLAKDTREMCIYFFFFLLLLYDHHHQGGRCSNNAWDFCSGGGRFEPRPAHGPSWHISRRFHQCLQANVKIIRPSGHGRLFLKLSQFVTHQSSDHWTLYSLDRDSVAK